MGGGLETAGCGQRDSCQFPASPRPQALSHRFVPRHGRHEDIPWGCASGEQMVQELSQEGRDKGTMRPKGLAVIPGRGQGSGYRHSPSPQKCSETAHTSCRGRQRPVPGGIQVQVKSETAKSTPGPQWKAKVTGHHGKHSLCPPQPPGLSYPTRGPATTKRGSLGTQPGMGVQGSRQELDNL